jgi:hypothetical protein
LCLAAQHTRLETSLSLSLWRYIVSMAFQSELLVTKMSYLPVNSGSAYHPQTDGSTECANYTITTMLRQCVKLDQKDWVSCLPAIEFAINLARLETTRFAPFFLNTGCLPHSLIWNNPDPDKYPSVKSFAQQMKQAVMTAHNAIIKACVKQTSDTNQSCWPSLFKLNNC